ncbi:MAG: hypothetical protein R3F29_14930 [Planctomycetota bacterium]
MDVMGGAAISRGPHNLLAQHTYTGTPICITVEGANILTRTLMVFGQGDPLSPSALKGSRRSRRTTRSASTAPSGRTSATCCATRCARHCCSPPAAC